jgi:hypothetical protein
MRFFWSKAQGYAEGHHGQCVINGIQRYSCVLLAYFFEFGRRVGYDALLDFLGLHP